MKNTIYIIIAVVVIILAVISLGGDGNDIAKLGGETETVEAGLGDRAVASGLVIIPSEVVEDSRCQEDIKCDGEEGTVKLRASLIVGDGEEINNVRIFEWGKIFIIEDKAVVLSKVSPNTNSQKVINPEDYTFTFEVGSAVENPIVEDGVEE